MSEQPSYYAIIPANVRYDRSLKANEKLLYGEITALSGKSGSCWATNGYFSELYGVSKISISNWISNLEKQGYIKTYLTYKDGSKEIEKRTIIISHTPIKENFNTPIKKVKEGIKENFNPPIKENFKENNTSINNTSINKYSPKSQKRYSDDSPYMKLSCHLLGLIKQRNPNHKQPNMQRWADDFRKLVELDKRDIDSVSKVIEWCQNDDFWQNNVLSANKVRKHYDKLYLQMNKPKSNYRNIHTEIVPEWFNNNNEQQAPAKEDINIDEEAVKNELRELFGSG